MEHRRSFHVVHLGGRESDRHTYITIHADFHSDMTTRARVNTHLRWRAGRPVDDLSVRGARRRTQQ